MRADELTPAELDVIRYAARNHGRTFVTELTDQPHNTIIHRLTDRGLFLDDGPSASGRWRKLTALGRAYINVRTCIEYMPCMI